MGLPAEYRSKFLPQGGDGAEDEVIRVENREPTKVVEGTSLASVSAGAKIDIIPVEKCATPVRSSAGPILVSERAVSAQGDRRG